MKQVRAYNVRPKDIQRATKAMNYNVSGQPFKSRVISIHPIDATLVVVIVEQEGFYPYLTGKWEDFLIPSEAVQ